MRIDYAGRTLRFKRYPATSNRSLQPISAADQLLLSWFQSRPVDPANEQGRKLNSANVSIQHDRFGVLTTSLHDHSPQFIQSFASQGTALIMQLDVNKVVSKVARGTPLDELQATEMGLLRMPKSLQLFELYLAQFANMAISSDQAQRAVLSIGFMTKYFSKGMLEIAGRYANDLQQSKAVKKARLLHLRDFKTAVPKPADLLNSWSFNDTEYRQYYGTFSADHIDLATRFFLNYVAENGLPQGLPDDRPVQLLDIACGNGIIGNELLKQLPEARLFAVDDFILATSSAQLNLPADRSHVVWDDGLDNYSDESMDLAVINPPFHFGHETNIEVSLGLFQEAKRVLMSGASLLIVANRHLNYSTHLASSFKEVIQLAANDKFEIIRAVK